jgi:hypothetical protein
MVKIQKTGGTQAMKLTINEVTAKVKDANEAIEQYKAENPGVDVEAFLSEQNSLSRAFGQIATREVDKFVSYAKEQGVKMPFDSMEMGILAAGRKDMQNGLAEILNSIDHSRPNCPECDEGMDNRGRSKKNL